MTDIRAILALEPLPFTWKGQPLKLKRPSLCDLVDAHNANEKGASHSRAWAIARHLLDDAGAPIFASPEDAMQCPLDLALHVNGMIEGLYSEGSD